jgi:hypothetical protein
MDGRRWPQRIAPGARQLQRIHADPQSAVGAFISSNAFRIRSGNPYLIENTWDVQCKRAVDPGWHAI